MYIFVFLSIFVGTQLLFVRVLMMLHNPIIVDSSSKNDFVNIITN